MPLTMAVGAGDSTPALLLQVAHLATFGAFFHCCLLWGDLGLLPVIAATFDLPVFNESDVVIIRANPSISDKEIFHLLNSRYISCCIEGGRQDMNVVMARSS